MDWTLGAATTVTPACRDAGQPSLTWFPTATLCNFSGVGALCNVAVVCLHEAKFERKQVMNSKAAPRVRLRAFLGSDRDVLFVLSPWVLVACAQCERVKSTVRLSMRRLPFFPSRYRQRFLWQGVLYRRFRGYSTVVADLVSSSHEKVISSIPRYCLVSASDNTISNALVTSFSEKARENAMLGGKAVPMSVSAW